MLISVQKWLLDVQVSINHSNGTTPLVLTVVCPRARRVKCDEAKPQCRRCSRAGRLCAGYQQLTTFPRTTDPLTFRISRSARHEHLARQGLKLLCSGLPSLRTTSPDVFEHKLLQLGCAFSSVNACAYTLGITHELRSGANPDPELEVFRAYS